MLTWIEAETAPTPCFASAEKTRVVLAEADHRIANHLAMLASYVRLKGAGLARRQQAPVAADVALLILAIGTQITAISDLHRMLSAGGAKQGADLGERLSRICAALQSGSSGEVEIVGAFDTDCTLAVSHVLPVTQICTELITNAIKYGCGSDGCARIRVECSMTEAGEILVEISDQGPGLPSNRPAVAQHGLGFRLVEDLIRQVGGSIDYQSTTRGLTVRLCVPGLPGVTGLSDPTPSGADNHRTGGQANRRL